MDATCHIGLEYLPSIAFFLPEHLDGSSISLKLYGISPDGIIILIL